MIPGAIPVRQGFELDLPKLELYFQTAKIPNFVAPFTVVLQFTSGQSNPTYFLRDSKNNEFVLRKKPGGKILPSAVRYQWDRSFLTCSMLWIENIES